MKDLEKELIKFAAELESAHKNKQIEGFALIGGLAVSVHARPRATKDIDFLVSADREFFNKSFPNILRKKGYKIKVFKGDLNDPISGLIRIYGTDESEIADFIPVFWKWQDEIVRSAEKISISKSSIPIARIEDLMVLKLKAGGPQDIVDLQELIKAAELSKKIDQDRLFALAKRAGVDKKLKRYFS